MLISLHKELLEKKKRLTTQNRKMNKWHELTVCRKRNTNAKHQDYQCHSLQEKSKLKIYRDAIFPCETDKNPKVGQHILPVRQEKRSSHSLLVREQNSKFGGRYWGGQKVHSEFSVISYFLANPMIRQYPQINNASARLLLSAMIE